MISSRCLLYIFKYDKTMHQSEYISYCYEKRYKEKMKRLFHPTRSDSSPILTWLDWTRAKRFFDFRCAYCRRKKPLVQEHFIPESQGGSYSVDNIIPACKDCNKKKLNQHPLVWFPNQSFFSLGRIKLILEYLEARA